MPAPAPIYDEYDLFGGAIKVELPKGLVDASDLREVPNNQEVFLSPDSDVSYIFEVLQMVTEGRAGEDLEQAARFHFDSLAHDNSADSATVEQVSLGSDPKDGITPQPITLSGMQKVRKFGRASEPQDEVCIFLALWRIKEKNADFVFSVNVPRRAGEEFLEKMAGAAFERAVKSLRILNLGLFAG